MLASAIIVFREVLEAALILSIVAAATRTIAGRNKWLLIGVASGLTGAVIVAALATRIAEAMEGLGQEVFNATILMLAVAMLGWHNIWMQSHGRQLASSMTSMGSAVAAGSKSMFAVAIAVGLAVLREGSEVVLFLYGIAGSGSSAVELLAGSMAGLAIGAAVGWGLYAGLLRLSMKRLFAVTSWMILFLAAGMAASAAKFLVQADLLPALGNAIWDTSSWLPDDSIVGQLLHVLVGYTARPSGIQILFHVSTLLLIGGLMLIVNRRTPIRATSGSVVTAAALITLGLVSAPRQAQAGFKVYTPYVEYHEFEIEYRPSVTVDGDDAKDNEQKHLVGFGYGVTEWWFTEIYAEWEREAGAGEETSFEAFEWENKFQLTDPGEYWADLGVLVEYERTDDSNAPDKIELAFLAAKGVGSFDLAYNLIIEREVGTNASDDVVLAQAFQAKYRLDPAFEPGIELYSEFGAIGDMPGTDEQEHFIGPVVEGKIPLGDTGTKLKYNVGYMFGLTDETPDSTVKAVIELEFPL